MISPLSTDAYYKILKKNGVVLIKEKEYKEAV